MPLDLDEDLIRKLYTDGMSLPKIARELGCERRAVLVRVQRMGLTPQSRSQAAMGNNTKYQVPWEKVQELSATHNVREIAETIGYQGNQEHLRRGMVRRGIPRLSSWAGERNPAWNGGRVWVNGGYLAIYVPDHPQARKRHVLESRLVMEAVLGRYLEPQEVVDHIDGCIHNNSKKNLRLFPDNATHLRVTLTGRKKQSEMTILFYLDGPIPSASETGAQAMLRRHPLFPFPGPDKGLGRTRMPGSS